MINSLYRNRVEGSRHDAENGCVGARVGHVSGADRKARGGEGGLFRPQCALHSASGGTGLQTTCCSTGLNASRAWARPFWRLDHGAALAPSRRNRLIIAAKSATVLAVPEGGTSIASAGGASPSTSSRAGGRWRTRWRAIPFRRTMSATISPQRSCTYSMLLEKGIQLPGQFSRYDGVPAQNPFENLAHVLISGANRPPREAGGQGRDVLVQRRSLADANPDSA